MNAPKPFASLSSGLLARKGAAKPAMRPQGFVPGTSLEDLGWNDMGYAPQAEFESPQPAHVPSSIAALTPAPRPALPEAEAEPEIYEPAPPPPVVEQQRAIAESFAEEPEAETESDAEVAAEAAPVPAPRAPADIVALPKRRGRSSAVASKAKAAFTLRLDQERHLKLRLASAVLGRSSQQIVTEALDALIASIPEVEALAGQIPAPARKRS